MPVDPKDVRVGHCYTISGGQPRKVASIVDGRVHHVSLEGDGGGAPPPGSAETDLLTLEAFARAVEQEVPCPDVAVGKPSKAEG